MSPEIIKERILANIENSQVTMAGEECNSSIQVISSSFAGKSAVQRHRMVNDLFKKEFATGELHALSIKTSVPEAN